jgi:hypothetical protein
MTVEGGDLILFAGAARLRWGSVPGRELRGEPDAAAKSHRLREIAASKNLSDREFDLTIPAKSTPER